jgi:hypothetical protein
MQPKMPFDGDLGKAAYLEHGGNGRIICRDGFRNIPAMPKRGGKQTVKKRSPN